MEVYHSFYYDEQILYGDQHFDSSKIHRLVKLHELSVLLALKNYGNITLITNPRGQELLEHLPYTKIELFDEYINEIQRETYPLIKEYPNIWSLTKIIAYNQIANKNTPFLFIDYDVFLFSKLPDEFLNADIGCQEIEFNGALQPYYGLNNFLTFCNEKFIYSPDYFHSCNMGILWVKDLEFIKFYTKEFFKILSHPDNENMWKNYPNTCFIEQHYFAQCAKYKNIEPKTLLGLGISPYDLNYVHLLGDQKWADLNGSIYKGAIIARMINEYQYGDGWQGIDYGIKNFYRVQTKIKGYSKIRDINLGQTLQETISFSM